MIFNAAALNNRYTGGIYIGVKNYESTVPATVNCVDGTTFGVQTELNRDNFGLFTNMAYQFDIHNENGYFRYGEDGKGAAFAGYMYEPVVGTIREFPFDYENYNSYNFEADQYVVNVSGNINANAKLMWAGINADPMNFAVPDKITDLSGMYAFSKVSGLNRLTTNGLVEAVGMFAFCTDFGIGNKLDLNINCNHTDAMFYYCFDLAPKQLSFKNIRYADSMFWGCESFDAELQNFETSGAIVISSMFAGCSSFNHPINMPDTVWDASGLLGECSEFNSPVRLSDNLRSGSGIFSSCWEFNQPITLPQSLICSDMMFFGCSSFDQTVTIPENVISMAYMFANTPSLNSDVIIQTQNIVNANHIAGMFANSSIGIDGGNIYIHRSLHPMINVWRSSGIEGLDWHPAALDCIKYLD